jgi:hypothetical protein
MQDKLVSAMGGASIRDPFNEGRNYELMLGERTPANDSFLYVPHSPHPGLAIDVLRIDCTSPVPSMPSEIAKAIGARYQAFARTPDARFSLLRVGWSDVLFELVTDNALVPGYHHCIIRYVSTARSDFIIQVIRKVVRLSDEERLARLEFLERGCKPSMFNRGISVTYGAFALEAHRNSARLAKQLETLRGARAVDMSSAELRGLIAGASPFHNPDPWWVLTCFHAKTILLEGTPAEIDDAIRPLELALFSLDDQRGDAFIENKLFETAAVLGQLLMFAPAGQTPAMLSHAARLLRFAATKLSPPSAESLSAEVLAVLADLLACPDDETPLEAVVPDNVLTAARDEDVAGVIVSQLRQYAWRAMRLAEQGHMPMYRHAARALNLAYGLWARLPDFRDSAVYSAEMSRLSQDLISVQRASFSLSDQDIRDFIGRNPGLFGIANTQRPYLIYLRPLVTANRIRLRNEFPWLPDVREDKMRAALATVSLEGALNLAFAIDFDRRSLGGIPDLFGMERGMVFQSGDEQGESWRNYVTLMLEHAAVVMVLAGESEGLLWELSEIRRQQLMSRVVLVIPPAGTTSRSPWSSAALHGSLSAAGFNIGLQDLTPGFLTLTNTGEIDQRFTFNALWNYKLREAVLKRVTQREV